MECLICNQNFDRSVSLCNHLLRKHNISAQNYYDSYVKETTGLCKICSKPTKFLNLIVGYKECCCLEHTNLYRYGVKSNLNFEETKKKAQINSHTKEANQKGLQTRLERYGGSGLGSPEIRQKIEATNIEKYNAINPFQNEEVKQKCKDTRLKKYGDSNFNNRDRAKETCLDKYGTDHQMKNSEIQNKAKQTRKERYGVDYIFQLESTIKNSHTIEAQHKRIISNRNRILSGNYINKTEKVFMTLCKQYNVDVIPEYYSELYPYACDFYIPEKDLYIEVNIFWTHNTHFFTGSKEDLDMVNKWKSKGLNRAIDIWTRYDIEKRDTALKNNLNYLVFWSYKEIEEWFKKLEF